MKICKNSLICRYNTTCQFAKPTKLSLQKPSQCYSLIIEYDQFIRNLRKDKINKIQDRIR